MPSCCNSTSPITSVFYFFLRVSLLLGGISSAIDTDYTTGTFNFTFDLRFICGKTVQSDGRIYFRACDTRPVGGKCIELLDAQLKDGKLNKSVDVEIRARYKEYNYRYEMFVRTNCYVFNRIGECCAHDFKFTAFNSLKSNYGLATCTKEEEGRCEGRVIPAAWINSNKELTKFTTFNPKNKKNVIDLLELLLEPERFKQYFTSITKKRISYVKNPKSTFASMRHCSPRDDQNDLMAKDIKENQQSPSEQPPFKICDHPEYGFVAKEEQKNEEEEERNN